MIGDICGIIIRSMKNKYFNAELLAISLITITGTFVYAYVSCVLNTDSWPDSFISIWNTWDTQHYIKIAADGYSSTTSDDRHLLPRAGLEPCKIRVCAYDLYQHGPT